MTSVLIYLPSVALSDVIAVGSDVSWQALPPASWVRSGKGSRRSQPSCISSARWVNHISYRLDGNAYKWTVLLQDSEQWPYAWLCEILSPIALSVK